MSRRASDHLRAEDIAIVGMACVFPSAANLQSFWENIVGKKDAISDPPPEWRADLVYDPDPSKTDKTYTKRGGFLGDLCAFDPLKHGVVPNSVDGGEPDQFLALEITERALADAEFAKRPVARERVEIVLGRGISVNRGISTLVQHGIFVDRVIDILHTLHPEHTGDELARIREELKASLPPLNNDMAASLIPSLATGRIANRLDFRGANYIIDAACASSHIAAQRGVEDLRSGRCDVAVVGGCQASTPAPHFLVFSRLGALSPRGEIRPFDKDADGTLMSEGVGILVLKRLSTAEAAGDRIYALIKAIGSSSDGRATGILAPRVEGQVLALSRAYEESGVDPATIELVEAHGTGTPVGDAAEVETLKAIYGPRKDATPSIALGSVKSMIGHCLPAAGSAGLIKAALALYTKTLPPTIHCEHPNPALGLDTTPFYLNTEARPWIHGAPWPRRAGVNAFGFGGINGHAILEEYRPQSGREVEFPLHRASEVLILEAQSRADLIAQAKNTAHQIAQGADRPLVHHARRLNTSLHQAPCRLAVVASSHEEAVSRLGEATERLADANRKIIRDRRGIFCSLEPRSPRPRLAFMFPGEGSQYKNMLRDLCFHFPEVREWFDRIDRIFYGHNRGLLPSAVIFPPPGDGKDKRGNDPLWRMDVGPETIFAASQAVHALLRRIKLQPDAIVGHSTGEYSALAAAGCYSFSEEKLKRDILALNAHFENVTKAGMIARGVLVAVAGVDSDALQGLLAERDDLFLAMDNCPQQQVVCALSTTSAEWLELRLNAMNALSATLPFDRAYHTPAFQPFCDGLGPFFRGMKLEQPRVPIYSCVTAAPFPDDVREIEKLAIAQWASRVRFRETVRRMHDDGISIFVECAPRNNLCAFVDDILRGQPHLACPIDIEHRDGITQLNHLIAQLAVEQVPLDLRDLYPTAAEDDAPKRPLMKLNTGLQPMTLSARPEHAPPPAAPRAETPPPSPPHTTASHVGQNGSAASKPKPIVVPERETMIDDAPQLVEAAPSIPLWAEAAGPQVGEAFAEGEDSEPDPVLAAYFGTMETFLRSQQEVMAAFLSGANAGSGAGSAPAVETLPLAARASASDAAFAPSVRTPIEKHAPYDPEAALAATPDWYPLLRGGQFAEERGQTVIKVRWDVRAHRYLLDHTMGRGISALDADLTSLPVVPFTFSMEALAEAGALTTGRGVLAMLEVRAYRWIGLDDGSIDLELLIRPSADASDQVHVAMRRARGPNDNPALPQPAIAEADIVLGNAIPEAPSAMPQRYTGERPSRLRPEDLYSEVMFHGPRLQALVSMELYADDGSEGTLVGLPHDDLFDWTKTPRFFTDPITTDNMGQLIGMWTDDDVENGMRDFPFRLERFDVFGASLTPGERTKCRARIECVGTDRHRSDIDVIDHSGHIRFRMTGWWDKRFDMPARFHALRCNPSMVLMSSPMPHWLHDHQSESGLSCMLVDDVPLDFLEPSGEFWLRALAQIMLSRNERQFFKSMAAKVERRAEWLLGRIAAKDAVRELLSGRGFEGICPADVEIMSEDSGRPVVGGHWPAAWGEAPYISIAHKGGRALAMAGASASWAGVGIDIERIESRPRHFLETAFSEHEIEALARAEAQQEDLCATRFWCVKEALGKALGLGLPEILSGIEVEAIDPTTGRATLRRGADRFAASTLHDTEWLIALVAIPRKQ